MTSQPPVIAELVGGPHCGKRLDLTEPVPTLTVEGVAYYFDTLRDGVIYYTFWR